MKNTLITLASVATLAVSANAQFTNLNYDLLGADASTVFGVSGQDFTDIGALLGLSEFDGVDLNINFVANETGVARIGFGGFDQNGVAIASGGTAFNLQQGTIFFTFSESVTAEQRSAGGLTNTELNFFGTNGTLTSTHTEAGLNVTSNSVENVSGATVVTDGLVFEASGRVFIQGAAPGGYSNGSIGIGEQVPEPSSTALLGLGALGLLARRKR